MASQLVLGEGVLIGWFVVLPCVCGVIEGINSPVLKSRGMLQSGLPKDKLRFFYSRKGPQRVAGDDGASYTGK